jgi:hypothetical protein
MKPILSLENEHLKFKINNRENYSLLISDLKEAIDVTYPSSVAGAPTFKRVSEVIAHLLTTRSISLELIMALEAKTKELFPGNQIDWDNTNQFCSYFKDFEELYAQKHPSVGVYVKVTEGYDERMAARIEVIKELKAKYPL